MLTLLERGFLKTMSKPRSGIAKLLTKDGPTLNMLQCNGMLPPSAITKGVQYLVTPKACSGAAAADQDVVGVMHWSKVRFADHPGCGVVTGERPDPIRAGELIEHAGQEERM
jgi:hypothetical protein